MNSGDDDARALAARKLGGAELSDREIEHLVIGYTAGDIGDDSMAQWLRAVCSAGMTIDETTALTKAMAASGETIDWGDVGGTVVDKHSTGGVGDAVSLVAVPLAAACGVRVAKLSGRALGHTGGTLDKIECVPGARVDLSTEAFKAQVEIVGCAVAAASADLAPADKKLYALRHRTDTIASIPLIAASIMSKKIAAGAAAIVLDVKVGAGAFMRDIDEARELARTMVEVGSRMGKRIRALLTDMDAPLADAVGDALELDQALCVLEGGGSSRLREVSCAAAAAMLDVVGIANLDTAAGLLDAALRSGDARSKLQEMLAAQGGDLDRFDRKFPEGVAIAADDDGYVNGIDAGAIGAAVARTKHHRPVDDARRIGVRVVRHVGERVGLGEPVLRYLTAEPEQEILRLLKQAVNVGKTSAAGRPLLLGAIANV
ncbi:MAG TPA: thymidine phosphorylase [Candidatus Eremiobacteraceae bacterium]